MSKSIFKENEENKMGVIEEVLQESYLPEKIENNEVALTYGGKIAIRRKDGSYVVYDEEQGQLVNQLSLVLDMDIVNKFIYLVPTQSVKKGDIIKMKQTYYYVIAEDNTKLKAINLSTGTNSSLTTEINIITNKTVYKKVTNLMEGGAFGGGATGFNPMMLMLLGDKEMDLATLMLMQGMTGTNNNAFGNMNPMMLLALKDGKSDLSNLLMLQAFSGGNMFGAVNNTTNE